MSEPLKNLTPDTPAQATGRKQRGPRGPNDHWFVRDIGAGMLRNLAKAGGFPDEPQARALARSLRAFLSEAATPTPAPTPVAGEDE
jgi:hypothetical protein